MTDIRKLFEDEIASLQAARDAQATANAQKYAPGLAAFLGKPQNAWDTNPITGSGLLYTPGDKGYGEFKGNIFDLLKEHGIPATNEAELLKLSDADLQKAYDLRMANLKWMQDNPRSQQSLIGKIGPIAVGLAAGGLGLLGGAAPGSIGVNIGGQAIGNTAGAASGLLGAVGGAGGATGGGGGSAFDANGLLGNPSGSGLYAVGGGGELPALGAAPGVSIANTAAAGAIPTTGGFLGAFNPAGLGSGLYEVGTGAPLPNITGAGMPITQVEGTGAIANPVQPQLPPVYSSQDLLSTSPTTGPGAPVVDMSTPVDPNFTGTPLGEALKDYGSGLLDKVTSPTSLLERAGTNLATNAITGALTPDAAAGTDASTLGLLGADSGTFGVKLRKLLGYPETPKRIPAYMLGLLAGGR